MLNKSAWLQIEDAEKDLVFSFSEDYKKFLSVSKTERLACSEIIRQAKEHGFRDLEELFKSGEKFKAGDKFYLNHKNKSVALFVMGTEPLENGLNIVGAHIDSPRLDVKQNPLYEANNLTKMKTHYYGGVKLYQYATIPLAIHGVIYNSAGEKIEVHIGEDKDDPVFCVTDLLIHLSKNQMAKTAREALVGEQMNILIGNIPLKDTEKDAVKENILKLIKEKYNFEEEDFRVAELEIVPAGEARDLGLDRSMVIGYGQDDRVCAYTALIAEVECKNPKYTTMTILTDKEEIGSVGNTGLNSHYVYDYITYIAENFGADVKDVCKKSACLSSDVNAAFDPGFPDVYEKNNSCYLNHGCVLTKYTGSRGKGGSSDASAEFMAKITDIMDRAGVYWQVGELGAVDVGGGGTIAQFVAALNIDVVDLGVPIISMHSPFEISSKLDVYNTYLAFKAFYEEN